MEKEYRDRVKPFEFLLSLQANKSDLVHAAPRGIAPYNSDVIAPVECCFYRRRGSRVRPDQLKTIPNAVIQFHLHPESKFFGRNFRDRGKTQRCHVWAHSIEHIGKEANKWEKQMHIGETGDNQQVYGSVPVEDMERLEVLIKEGRRFSRRQLAKASQVSLRHVTRVLKRYATPSQNTVEKLEFGISTLLMESESRPSENSLIRN